MRIIWAPNPLATVVELDDIDTRLLWHRVKIMLLEEILSEVHFDLDVEFQKWRREALKERCPVDFVAEARRHLDYAFIICGDEKRNGKTFDEYVSAETNDYVKELTQVHCGDCTCVACSCAKCHAEDLVGVETRAGLGKHEAAFIWGAFSPGDGKTRTLNEVLVHLRDYEPKDVAEWGLPHVGRWRAEAKRAYDWLLAYQREHFEDQEV